MVGEASLIIQVKKQDAWGFTFYDMDEKFRALDIDNGVELWKTELPTAGMAVPMSYEYQGRQYIAISAGGHSFLYPQNPGDELIVFALPEDQPSK